MSENKDKEQKQEGQNPPTEPKERKLKIEVSRDQEVDSLQEELGKLKQELDSEKTKRTEIEQKTEAEKLELTDKVTQYEAEKAQLALEQFEKDKKGILDLCKSSGLKEEQIKEIEDKLKTPQQLESVKSMTNMLVSMMPKKEETPPPSKDPAEKAPAGKAPLTPPEAPAPEMSKDGVKMIDEIYEIIQDTKGKYTPQQKKEANDKRLMLWGSLIGGKSWEQLKKGTPIGSAVTMSCPGCGITIHGNKVPEKCEHCGFDFTKTGDRHPVGK